MVVMKVESMAVHWVAWKVVDSVASLVGVMVGLKAVRKVVG